jgi:hypothetical protein
MEEFDAGVTVFGGRGESGLGMGVGWRVSEEVVHVYSCMLTRICQAVVWWTQRN